MQSLVKQLLTLSNTSAANQWQQIETTLQPKQLTPAEIADVAHHFAVNNQGSELFWDTLQRATVDQLSNFNREQLATVFDAMMKTPYEVPDDVGEAVTKAIDTFFNAELQANQKSDPYYLSKFLLQFQSGLGQFALNFGPGFLTGRVNDEHPEQKLAKGDEDLSESSNSELRSAFIKGELSQEQVNEEKKKFLNSISELLGKNQNAQDITNLK
ncbi:unnamed protein product (macronuclear) [Paramecium tetraurelia]|uniref:Uncharacterized protein n=1 Tax=Paramecium tetraurelia TaxID=5888 RepID=A0E0L4_PARTE|nr:uncharacterized protein GSPATT00021999001 [Paramecium tetraurelia]CAK88831.1 unnamed protein product [Paramecium tetraurelia]|eukprot:XP_001456228.1 hypothetical protein (macronuclear) [Paramecium tetraurelia strain d4-2]